MIPNPFCLASVPVAPIASSSNHLDRKPDADTSATSDAMQTAIATGASSLTRSGSSTIQAAKKALRGAMKAKLQSVSEESVVKQCKAINISIGRAIRRQSSLITTMLTRI